MAAAVDTLEWAPVGNQPTGVSMSSVQHFNTVRSFKGEVTLHGVDVRLFPLSHQNTLFLLSVNHATRQHSSIQHTHANL
jgi:hypothetical protein